MTHPPEPVKLVFYAQADGCRRRSDVPAGHTTPSDTFDTLSTVCIRVPEYGPGVDAVTLRHANLPTETLDLKQEKEMYQSIGQSDKCTIAQVTNNNNNNNNT